MKSMLVLFPLSVLMAATPYLSAPRGQLSATEKKDGWISLFDGRTTNGCHSYGMGQADSLWSAQDGVLHLKESTRKEHGDLLSNEVYGDFDLKLEWKVS